MVCNCCFLLPLSLSSCVYFRFLDCRDVSCFACWFFLCQTAVSLLLISNIATLNVPVVLLLVLLYIFMLVGDLAITSHPLWRATRVPITWCYFSWHLFGSLVVAEYLPPAKINFQVVWMLLDKFVDSPPVVIAAPPIFLRALCAETDITTRKSVSIGCCT